MLNRWSGCLANDGDDLLTLLNNQVWRICIRGLAITKETECGQELTGELISRTLIQIFTPILLFYTIIIFILPELAFTEEVIIALYGMQPLTPISL